MSRESFKISGKKFPLPAPSTDWRLTPRPGGWWIAERTRADGSIERCRLMATEAQGKLGIQLGGRPYFGQVSVKSRSLQGTGGTEADLIAQFPGKVRKILVEAGARVQTGDPLLLVEAMKMEFSVKAPADGVVIAVHVAEGQQLSPGDRFVDFVESGAS